MKNNIYDLVIVGGGPAGSSAAIAAAHFGLKTLILDRQKFPRDKICGDAFGNESFELLKEYGFNPKNISALDSVIKNKEFLFEDDQGFSFRLNNPNIFQCKRMEMDNFLWKSIPNYIDKLEQTEIINFDNTDESITCLELKRENEIKKIGCRFIIGADGYSSFVKRNFFSNLNFSNRVACRNYVKNNILEIDYLGFYFYPEINPGYFWIFPIGKNEYNTGVYLPHGSQKNIREIYTQYFRKHFKGEPDFNQYHTWPIPNNAQLDDLANEKAILIGDAAGLCDYLIGHGIDAAILSGILSSKSVNYYLKNNNGKYKMKEIYAYNMNAYLSKVLTRSEKLYQSLGNHSMSLEKIIETYLSAYHD